MLADIRHDFVQYLDAAMDEIPPSEVDAIFGAQAEEGRTLIARERVHVERVDVLYEVDIQYMGQTHVFRIPVRSPGFDSAVVCRDFARHFKERFDFELAGVRSVLVNARTAVLGRRRRPDLRALPPSRSARGRPGRRQVWFASGWHETSVYRRAQLPPGSRLRGPAIVEQVDATTVIDPGASAAVDGFGNLVVSVEG